MKYEKEYLVNIKKLIKKLYNYGDKIALVEKEKYITYTDLIYQIEIIGNNLLLYNINNIGICLNSRIDVILTALACLTVKIPFIIIEKNNPNIFNEHILRGAKINHIVCDEKISIKSINSIEFELLKKYCDCDINIKSSEYIIDETIFYIATSGSTGSPKIVKRYESAFCIDYNIINTHFNYLFNQVAQQYAKLNFSYGLENTLLLLFGGTTICFGEKNIDLNNIYKMFDEIVTNCSTIVFWATPIIKLFSKHFRLAEKIPNCVKYIYTGGEPLVVSADLVVILKNKNITLINDYGCSEIGKIFAKPFNLNLRDMDAYNMVEVGLPLKEYKAVVLDKNFTETSEGFLYLKSKEKFKINYTDSLIPINQIKINKNWFYKMQDIAKVKNGEIIILGREINSVNVYGYRIELEQVEHTINAINEIKNCVVLAYYNQYKEANLYCFYDGEIDSNTLRAKLKDHIPNYMIPISFTRVEKIFILPNGKVDRKKNNTMFNFLISNKNERATNIQEKICNYLSSIIMIERNKLIENYCIPFSELGIDSLTLVDFISTIEEKENVLIKEEFIGNRIKCIKDIVEWINDIHEIK